MFFDGVYYVCGVRSDVEEIRIVSYVLGLGLVSGSGYMF